jgi:hypothetical protein
MYLREEEFIRFSTEAGDVQHARTIHGVISVRY